MTATLTFASVLLSSSAIVLSSPLNTHAHTRTLDCTTVTDEFWRLSFPINTESIMADSCRHNSTQLTLCVCACACVFLCVCVFRVVMVT